MMYTQEKLKETLQSIPPDRKAFILADKTTERIIHIFEIINISDRQKRGTGVIIGFYLAGQIVDDKLASVIETELSTDTETAERYADAIIDAFAEDRELPKETPKEEPKRVPLAEELLKVAGTEGEKQPIHPNTTPVPPIKKELVKTPLHKPETPTEKPGEKSTKVFQIQKPTVQQDSKPLDAEIMDHFNKPPVVDPKKTQGRVENMGPAQNFSADNKKVVTNPFSDQGGAPQEEKVVPDNKMPPIVKPVTIPGNAVVPPFERQAEAEKTEPPHIEQEHNPTIDSANETSTQSYKGNDPYREPIN